MIRQCLRVCMCRTSYQYSHVCVCVCVRTCTSNQYAEVHVRNDLIWFCMLTLVHLLTMYVEISFVAVLCSSHAWLVLGSDSRVLPCQMQYNGTVLPCHCLHLQIQYNGCDSRLYLQHASVIASYSCLNMAEFLVAMVHLLTQFSPLNQIYSARKLAFFSCLLNLHHNGLQSSLKELGHTITTQYVAQSTDTLSVVLYCIV